MSEAKILEHNPLSEAEEILRDDFYGKRSGIPTKFIDQSSAETAKVLISTPVSNKPRKAKSTSRAKPTHYKVVCISLYTQDIEELEEKVAELKRRGHTKANKSQLIRQALRMLDLDELPPPQQ